MPKRQLRVGTQWLYVDEAEKLLREAMRIQAAEQKKLLTEGHVLPWYRRWLFSVDHKVIGIQYALTAMVFLLMGFGMMLLMRWQLAMPGKPIPLVGEYLGSANAPGGVMLPEFYNMLGAMHGTVMVFLAIVPL